MKYLNGAFKRNEIPEETVLCLTISDDKGQELEPAIPVVLKSYAKEMTVILFQNIVVNQADLVHVCKEIHAANIKTAVKIDEDDISGINKRLCEVLDYILLNNGQRILKRDYCPFADAYDWIEM